MMEDKNSDSKIESNDSSLQMNKAIAKEAVDQLVKSAIKESQIADQEYRSQGQEVFADLVNDPIKISLLSHKFHSTFDQSYMKG